MDTDRKTLIADAAIALLGTQGARGLTHRAVDAQAGLPAGSTSFYCRTRLELLKLTLARHVALDLADLAQDASLQVAASDALEALLERLQHRLAVWLSAPQRARLVARYELFLLAAHEPELAAILAPMRERFLQATHTALMRCGVTEPAQAAHMLVTVVDGHLLDAIRSGSDAPLSEAQRAMLRRLLAG